ncbi:MAG: DMT family transporter [Thermomicrobiales bacterium]
MIEQDWGSLGVPEWGALLYSSAISMLLAYTIWGWAIQRGGVARTALFLYLIPILTGVVAIPLLRRVIRDHEDRWRDARVRGRTFGPDAISAFARFCAIVDVRSRDCPASASMIN